jgi:arsenate reductase (glutaredoxin)
VIVKFYQYKNCSTCRKAQKFLDSRGIAYESIDITTQPPSEDELSAMLVYQNGELRKLFNTAGLQYRELGMKDRLANMSIADAIDLLAVNGKLIKRPFLLGKTRGLVGYKEADWEKLI